MPLNAVCVAGDIDAPIYTFLFFSLPASAADVFRLNSLPENESKQLDISASFFEIYRGKVTASCLWHPFTSSPYPLHPTPLNLT